MIEQDRNASPVNPIPPVVIALAAAIVLIEVAFQAGARGLVGGPEAVGWRQEAIQNFGFFSAYFHYLIESGQWRLDGLYRFVTYGFLHYNMTHALFAAVLVLALGNVTAKVFAAWAQLLVFALSSVMGAVVYGITGGPQGVLFGAYPAVYGLLGLYTWALWVAADRLGTNPYAAFKLVGVLVGIQVLFILIDGRWDSLYAEIAGFAAGFAMATLVAPGGVARLRARIRAR